MAYQMFHRAAELAPSVAGTWTNIGKCFHERQKIDEAEKCFRKSLELKPDYSLAMNNIGLCHLNRSNYEEVITWCTKALKLEPDLVDAKINRGMAQLALGKWKEGWAGYNLNVGTLKDRKERQYNKETRWAGQKDATVICFGEQGIGDEISFASCLPDLIRDSKNVIIDCDRRLEGLWKRSFPDATIHGTRYDQEQTWPKDEPADYRVAIGQLPQFYRSRDEDFPGTPYLVPDPEMRIQWRALLDSLGTKLKVGIAWTGGRPHTWKERRSTPLESLLPILRNDCTFISLQYLDPKDEIEAFTERHGIEIHHWPWAVENYDFDQTAALVNELDLVITVTTTAVHLAGALGKECWCMVPKRVMWRYGTKGSWFPWAKSVTLFREKETWPIKAIAEKLKERVNDSHRSN